MLDFDLLKDCYGCGACVNVCPRGAVHMTQAADGSYIPEIDEARCIGCGTCVQVCPAQCITLENRLPVFGEGCVSCFACAQWCPKQAVSLGRLRPQADKQYHNPRVTATEMEEAKLQR